MKKIKTAQIGWNLNSHSEGVFDSLKKLNHMYEIAGYALPENEREKYPFKLAHLEGYKELSVEEILKDPEIEAVTIETDEIHLTKYALMAAEHNKHIHMEKPGGLSLSDFEKLITLMKKSGKVFHTGYMYRYNPCIKELLQKVKNKELGEIISVDAEMNCIHNPETRQWLAHMPGGMMFFLGCHLVDLILQIQGKPERIIPLSRSTAVDGVTAEDFGMAVFEYKNGVSFAKTNAVEYGGYARRNIVVTGSKGTIEINPLEMYPDKPGTEIYAEKTEYSCTDWNNKGIMERTQIFERYDVMMEAFAKIVAGEMENTCSYDYELELYKTVLAACGEMKYV